MNDLLAAADRVRAAVSKPPTSEIGVSTTSGLPPLVLGLTPGVPGWQSLVDDAEQVPELRWAPYGRGSVAVFNKMRTDPQIQGLLWGLTLPIRRYEWFVDPNGASERTVTEFAQDLNLPVKDQPRATVGRTRDRFSHDDHLRHALLALTFGHIYFEQVGEVVADGQGPRWRLRKLAPRMPQSLERILLNERGGLAGIVQAGHMPQEPIPVDRLVAYVWDREASNWAGRSLLRAMYGPWLIKQRLVRVDAIKHERNGMGIPFTRQTVPQVDPSAMAAAQTMAQSIRAGEIAGATLPYGFDVDLKGVSGSLPDTMASIRYCDEVMARSVLMMFMMLGQTETGSRALGGTFVDYINLNQHAIADWYVDVTSAHVGEDWTDWNDGPDAQAPRIGYDPGEDSQLGVTDLVAAIDAGIVVVSEEDETAFRERYDLPEKGAPRRTPEQAAALQRLGASKRTLLGEQGFDPDAEEAARADEATAAAEAAAKAFDSGAGQ